MKKIALVKKSTLSDWRSCQLITSNLEKVYLDDKEFEVDYLYVNLNFNRYSAFELAQAIKEKAYSAVVWLEHKPCAAELINALDKIYIGNEKRPQVIVHLFGDFVLDCVSWENAERALKSTPVTFVASSHKQKALVDSFFNFNNGQSQVCVLPFPVNELQFNLKDFELNRKTYREKFDAKLDDFVFVYTGRISYQKNIEMLLKVFESMSPVFGDRVKLWIAGPWDNIFLPYAGKFGAPGSYFNQINSTIDLLKLKNIKFIGEFESEELNKIYHSADCFISFSTFNDEDYGMSPAEALMTGLPCVLSHWGGYSSFREYSSNVQLVPVNFNSKRPEVQPEEARKILAKMSMTINSSLSSREKNLNLVKSCLGINELKIKVSEIIKQESGTLSSFSSKFFKLCALSKLNPGAPFRDKNLELSPFYKEVYELYAN